MASIAIHPPVHLTIHPDEPIRTVEDAVKVITRHARNPENRDTQTLLLELNNARTPSQADRVAAAFRAWAKAEGLLLVPPEDRPNT